MYNENKRFVKNKKICSKTKLALAVSSSLLVFSQFAYAAINEKPEAGQQYNDFLYWDGEVQINDYPTAEKHYYFNKGAQIGGKAGGTGNAVLIGQGDDAPNVTFHVGKAEGKDYDLTLIGADSGVKVSTDAQFHIFGEETNIKFGPEQWDSYGDAATIYVDEGAVFTVNAANMWTTGGAETNLKLFDNAQATINLSGDFIADAGGTGIANQNFYNGSNTQLTINANNISLSTTDLPSAERKAGLYLLAYNDDDHKGGNSTMHVELHAENELNISGFSRGVQTFGSSDVELTGNNVTISALTEGSGRGLALQGQNAEKSTHIKIAAANEVNILASERAVYANDRVNIERISGKTVNIHGGEYGVYLAKNSVINSIADETLTVSADNGWSVCLFSGSTADFTSVNTTFNDDIYVKESDLNAYGNANNINAQVKVLDGGTTTFASATKDASGYAKVIRAGTDAVIASSDTQEKSTILFKQKTYINSQGDEKYHAERQGIRTDSAIRALRNSEITLNSSSGIYGDVIAGRGIENSTASGGKVTINSIKGADFKGDWLAGNSGQLDITLNDSAYEGRIDDYADASLNGTVFRPAEFDIDVTEGGTVNLALTGSSTWRARGQSFVSELKFAQDNQAAVDLTTDATSSVTIRNLQGNGTFNMKLSASEHSVGNMLYIGKNEGYQTINIIGGIDGGLDSISEDNPLRIATVGIDIDDSFTVNNSGISRVRAFTKDAGINDLEYIVTKEKFDKTDSENELYNGADDGQGVNKPGNDFVENELVGDRDTAVNWIITGVKGGDDPSETHTSDAGKSVINMSRANYANAVYMDTLNKRQGEARFVGDTDHGVWVRLRHDNIGKDDSFRTHNTMVEVGFEQRDVNDYGEFHTGFALDYMNGQIDYHTVDGNGDIERYGVWFYTTYLGNDGQYADLVLKYGHLKNDFGFNTRSQGEHVTGDYTNEVASISAEYGWKFSNSYNYYIEPQVQLQYSYVTGADYTTSQGSKVDLDSIHSLIGRVGFRAGKDFNTETPITAYIRGDVLHEFLGDQDIYAYDNTGVMDVTYENDDTWYSAGVGLSVQSSENTYFFIEGEQVFGADNDNTYTVSGGFKHSF